MEEEANNLIASIKSLGGEGKERGTIKALLKKFILPETDNMAIKNNQSDKNKCVYSVPIKPELLSANQRLRSISEAKKAFLNATVNISHLDGNNTNKPEPSLHYAQIAVTTDSDDTRSTGGGGLVNKEVGNKTSNFIASSIPPYVKKNADQQRKVSFKIKNASTSYRRPPIPSKTNMTVTTTKVSELTKKFNDLIDEPKAGIQRKPKISKTTESGQSSRCTSNNSTPTSTLSSSPNIKVVIRQRRGAKKRNSRKRCSSMDSIDKNTYLLKEKSTSRVLRSKSDGTKNTDSTNKRLKNQSSIDSQSGSDSVDGPDKVSVSVSPLKINQSDKLVVKNVVKKFECEIIAQSNSNNTLKRQTQQTKVPTVPLKEKPKVPEKKSSLVVTKNVVVKDGVPKIRTIKHFPNDLTIKKDTKSHSVSEAVVKKQQLSDRKKFKTNYIHSEKMPLHVVEIIHEDVNESKVTVSSSNQLECVAQETNINTSKDEIKDQVVRSDIAPNESFLWRRKSYTQIYCDNDKSIAESSGSSQSLNEITITINTETLQEKAHFESQVSGVNEFQRDGANGDKCDTNSDFESNLVEAYNKEVLKGFSTKAEKEVAVENDYEVLEPKDVDNVIVIPVINSGTLNRSSKINCPLPEIPKEEKNEAPESPECLDSENIYQCLLEMRSHPEGDESSMHNYELYDSHLEERTRGDGDSDDGYEYCKSPIKPFCETSSSGIKIAENYKPNDSHVSQNFNLTKSVSGTSTVSYEKIGTERIYEKIPSKPKSKTNSPTHSTRHSIASSDYTGYNDNHENIYDTIKQGDGTSLSNCYESIPNSPSMVKIQSNFKKQLASAVKKRLSLDNVSNISQSTMSSEQKTNSIYGQRSVISFNGHEIAFQVPSSETSVSDRSDRSDDWVDVSDEEKNDQQKVIIVRERSRGRKSPLSWSQKVRHQRQSTTKPVNADRECDSSDSGHLYESLEPAPAHAPHAPHTAHAPPVDDDFDSFDSDTDTDDHEKYTRPAPELPTSRLPSPPSGGPYTLTKIASAAQRKMRQLKRNLTKRYSVAMDGKSFMKASPTTPAAPAPTSEALTNRSPIYANCPKPTAHRAYSNINFNDTANKTDNPVNVYGTLKDELQTVINEKRLSNGGDAPPPLPDNPPLDKSLPEKATPLDGSKKDLTLSRKAYFSFKSRFRRATSMAVDINDVPSALKITNSTFYLTDSMDGDSGFSNCSDSGQPGSTETLSAATVTATAGDGPPAAAPAGTATGTGRRRDGRLRGARAESSPCLALARPAQPPPPPPPHATASPPAPAAPPACTPAATDLSAVNEELKRLLPTLSRKEKAPRTRTSWYAECGADTPQTHSNASWYAEAGLYQAGTASSSSGASSDSHPASPLPHSLFTHEPLYQFYNAAKVESVCRETGDSDSDAYDPGSVGSGGSAPPAAPTAAAPRPSAMALVAPRGPARTLWCEVPEVVNSAVLSSLAPAQKRLQEAKFEVLTSEASYLNSLRVLEAQFAAHPALRGVLDKHDWDALFANILPVRRCSQQLMAELEQCWQENILLAGICDVVRAHAERHFHVYVKYCEGQAPMVRALQRLRERPAVAAALARLESHPACQSLSLHSFLMLPMQRVTRLPLLLDAVLKHLAREDQEYDACVRALTTLNNLVSQCNEGARNTERVEEMWRLARAVEFPAALRDPPQLGPACARRDRRPVRWLVRSGEMTHLLWKADELKLTFGKKYHKTPLHLFLFNDLLVITKKKSAAGGGGGGGGEAAYVAVDHCPRSMLEVCASEAGAARHALLLTLLENHEGRTVEMLMSLPNETELSRWSEALSGAGGGGGGGGGGAAEGEAVYAGWDCPQVAALYAYAPAQPDELPLAEGDVVNVTRKTSEGWYYGERTRDGEAGWFPGAYTVEIASAHVRARNLRQRYRLLALSGTYRGLPAHRRP